MGMAFIELRRFDEAIGAGKRAQHQNPFFAGAYRCLASAFGHLGRDAEAREAAAHLLEVDPGFTITAYIARGGQSNSTHSGSRDSDVPGRWTGPRVMDQADGQAAGLPNEGTEEGRHAGSAEQPIRPAVFGVLAGRTGLAVTPVRFRSGPGTH